MVCTHGNAAVNVSQLSEEMRKIGSRVRKQTQWCAESDLNFKAKTEEHGGNENGECSAFVVFFFPIQFAACTGILVGVIHQTEGRGFDERAGLTTDVM